MVTASDVARTALLASARAEAADPQLNQDRMRSLFAWATDPAQEPREPGEHVALWGLLLALLTRPDCPADLPVSMVTGTVTHLWFWGDLVDEVLDSPHCPDEARIAAALGQPAGGPQYAVPPTGVRLVWTRTPRASDDEAAVIGGRVWDRSLTAGGDDG